MSLRIDSTEWISGALLIGETGLGVLGSAIPATGDSGPGYCYNDLSLPADADKEICGRITTWPIDGVLAANEDTSFTYTPAGDGSRSFEYQLYVDGVAVGSPVAVTLEVGAVNANGTGALQGITLTAPTGTAIGTSTASATGVGSLASITLSAPQGTAIGTSLGNAVGIGALPTITLTAPQGTAAGTWSGSAVGVGTIRAITLSAPRGTAIGTGLIIYARAPSGSGYQRDMIDTPRPRQTNTTRH